MDTVTLPSYWACALINGDYSGLADNDATMCRRAALSLAREGWHVVSAVDDSERFTWRYRAYCPDADCDGGDVVDYVVLS